MKKISLYKLGFFLIFSAILSLGISSEAKANYAFYNGDNGLFSFDSGLAVSGPFYFQDYGGGWFMSDGTWIRTYNSKNVWTAGGLLGTDGGLTVGYGGTTPPSGGAVIAGNVGIGTNNPGAKLDVAGGMRGTSMTISTLGAGVIMADSSGTFYTTPLSTINSGIITGAAQWNPDGDGPDLIYDDGNPTYNGKAFGAIINMNGDGSQDGALVRSGAFEGNYFQAVNGFFIGSPDSNGTQIINSSGGAYFPGSVGIGTINPEAKLDVDGNITQSVTHGNNLKLWLSAARNGGSTGEVGLYSWISEPGATWTGGGIARNMSNSSSSFPRINTGLSGQMMHFTEAGNIEFVVENASGTRYTPLFVGLNSNVGIGSTVPVASLDVASKLRFTSGGTIYNADSSRWLDLSGALGDSLRVSGAIRMGSGLYNSNGNQVIEGNTSDWLRIAAGGGYTNGTAAYGNWAFGQGGVSIGSWIGNISSGNLYVSNNVGIGITNPTQKLEVNGNAVFDGIIGVGTAPSAGYAIDADGTIRASYFEGTATRANSLTANGSNCLAGQYPVGIDASGNAEGCTTAATTVDAVNYVNSPDGDRNPNNKLPTTSPQRVRFDFSNASYTGTGGNYAGVMTYAPWFGTTGSTGDASYQLAFGSTATNGSGIPQLRIRNGIDSTWNGWKTIITDNGNGNVGIGITNPSQKLEVNGNAVFDGLIGIGTAPSAGYAIDADGKIRASSFEGNLSGTATSLAANGTNCAAGSYPLGVDASGNAEGCTVAATGGLSGSGAANYVARWTGTTALSIGALYDNGTNVSIGTTAPGAKLDVQGKIRISNNGDNVYSSYSGGLNYELIGTYAGWNASTVYLAGYNASNGGSATAIAFGGSGKERLYTNLTTGNVGIGTTTPSTKLYVSGGDIYSSNSIMAGGDIYSNGSYYYGKDNNVVMEYDDGWLRLNPNGDFYSGIYAAGSIVRTDGELQVGGDGSTFRVINGGNVGIGTTAPRTKLEVNGTINTTNAGGNTTGELNVGPNGLYSWNGSTRYIRFNTSGTVNDLKSAGADLVINYDSGKNVQIGPGYNKPSKLSVVGNLAVGDATFVATAAPTSGLSVQGNTGIGTASPSSKLEVVGDAKATSFTYSSDRNLKTNIKTINNALSKIQKLRGVTFNWKKDDSKSVGLIAQEVEQVFPELVSGTEGNKGVEYGNLVGPLIEAVKEQQKEIDRLQYRISVLEKTSVKKTK